VATVAELEARLESLKAQRDSALARVSYGVEYRGTTEIARAIADLERDLTALQGKRRSGRSGSTPRRISERELGPTHRRSGAAPGDGRCDGDRDASICTWTVSPMPPVPLRRPTPAPCSASTAGAGTGMVDVTPGVPWVAVGGGWRDPAIDESIGVDCVYDPIVRLSPA
jgi:hypothetical protein